MGETITIPVEEYKELLEASVRLEIFAGYVSNERFNISREDCSKYLGFELEKQEIGRAHV